MGVIMRTAGENQQRRYFVRDLALLLEEWRGVQDRMKKQPPATCVFQEPDLIERTVRDFLTEDVERIGSRLSVIAFCLFLGIQLARTGINYFASLHTYGGLTSVFALDNTLETSNHLIRTDILYKELTGLHITTIMAEYFIALPLRFYDLRNHTFRSVIVTDHDVTHLLDEGALLPQEEPCIVMYADGLRRLTSEEVPNLKEISSDQHFIVGFYKPLDRHP